MIEKIAKYSKKFQLVKSLKVWSSSMLKRLKTTIDYLQKLLLFVSHSLSSAFQF